MPKQGIRGTQGHKKVDFGLFGYSDICSIIKEITTSIKAVTVRKILISLE